MLISRTYDLINLDFTDKNKRRKILIRTYYHVRKINGGYYLNKKEYHDLQAEKQTRLKSIMYSFFEKVLS